MLVSWLILPWTSMTGCIYTQYVIVDDCAYAAKNMSMVVLLEYLAPG